MTSDQSLNKIPNESFCSELASAMNGKYKIALKDRLFSITMSKKEEVVFVKILLSSNDGRFYYPVEGRINHKTEEVSPFEAGVFLADYIDIYFEEFLLEEEEELYLPIDWANHEYEALTFQIRGQIQNKKLDRAADHLLGLN